jgi:hypothetical protein
MLVKTVVDFVEDSEKLLKLEEKMTELVLRKLAAINLETVRN